MIRLSHLNAAIRLLSAAIFASLVFAACGGMDLTPEPVETEGMVNSVRVGDMLIGSQPSIEALSRFADEGYGLVISTRGENELEWDEKHVLDSLGLRFVGIPMPGPVTEISDQQIEAFDEAIGNADGKIVLHCASGNRASGLWAAWLVERKGIGAQRALDVAEQTGMKSIQPVVRQRLGLPVGN